MKISIIMVSQQFRLIWTWFVLVSILINVETTTLPTFIKPCKRNQTAFEICLINLFTGIRDRLPGGIDELKIRPLDPLQLSLINFDKEYELMTSIDYAIFSNISVIGSSNFLVKNLSLDWETPKLTIDIDFPFTNVDCNYNISASTLFVPVSGDGHFEGNFTNVSSHNIIYGEFYQKDNKKYAKVINQVVSLDIGSSSAHLADTGNIVKNALMNDFWSTLFAIIKPKVEIKIGEIAVSFIKEMLELFDIDSLIPE